jgi:hypothetical protein
MDLAVKLLTPQPIQQHLMALFFSPIISTHFPEFLPVTALFYKEAETVHHQWADGTWCTLLIEEGASQDCPLSPTFASLVVG